MFAAVALFAASSALAQLTPPGTVDRSNAKGDWERETEDKNWAEADFKLPAYPKAENLLEFEVSSINSFRFFIDGQSLSSSPDGVVRYTLVARSTSGVESVSFEGIRCKASTHRIYAIGRSGDRSWSASRAVEWKQIRRKSTNRQLEELKMEYLCPQNVPIATREEGIDALKRGGHPHSGNTRSASGRP